MTVKTLLQFWILDFLILHAFEVQISLDGHEVVGFHFQVLVWMSRQRLHHLHTVDCLLGICFDPILFPDLGVFLFDWLDIGQRVVSEFNFYLVISFSKVSIAACITKRKRGGAMLSPCCMLALYSTFLFSFPTDICMKQFEYIFL